MDAVKLQKADVFSYSMGSMVGLQLAIRHMPSVYRGEPGGPLPDSALA